MTTTAKRQRKFRQSQAEKGLAQLAAWVPANQVGALSALCRLLAENPHLEVSTLRDTVSGKFVKAP